MAGSGGLWPFYSTSQPNNHKSENIVNSYLNINNGSINGRVVLSNQQDGFTPAIDIRCVLTVVRGGCANLQILRVQVVGPSRHHFAPEFESIAAPIGLFHLSLDGVREAHLCNLAGGAGFGCPFAERGSHPVNRDASAAKRAVQQVQGRRDVQRPRASRAGTSEHQTGAVGHAFEDRERGIRERHAVFAAGFDPCGGHGPDSRIESHFRATLR